MAESQKDSNPAASDKTAGKKRRSSVMSMAPNIDKESLVQALDTIHYTASNSQTLTAFNDYTVPPAPSSPQDTRSIAEDISGSISGFYTRLKETVGVKTPAKVEQVDNGDVRSEASNKTLQSTPAGKIDLGKKRRPSPAPSQLSVNIDVKSGSGPGSGPRDSPSLRPIKSHVLDSPADSPTLQDEFKPTDRLLKPKLPVTGGTASIPTVSETTIEVLPSQQTIGDPADDRTTTMTTSTYTSEGRLSRSRNNREGSSLSSGQPATSRNQQKTSAQQRAQFLGLTRALSPMGNPMASSSTSAAGIDEDEEALSSVGQLPPRSKRTNAAGESTGILVNSKNKLIDKEFWMRDENAKDCFCCGDTFSAFRRKHHCRICGQIFDRKCTSLVSGTNFGQPSTVRVCKPCEGVLNGDADSSEFSDNGSIASGFRSRLGSTADHDLSPARSFASLKRNEARKDSIPTLAIPTRRLTEDSKRKSLIMEIDAEPARPGSARSLKPSALQRSHGSGHRRMHSKTNLKLPTRFANEASPAPSTEKKISNNDKARLPTFHSDNVIDPELADYLSDDDSSENEQLSLADALHDGRTPETAKPGGLAGLLAPNKKKSHLGDAFGKDPDIASISSAKIGRAKSIRNRNLSVSSNLNLKGSPRTHRYSIVSQHGAPLANRPSATDLRYMDSPMSFDGMDKQPTLEPIDSIHEMSSANREHLRQMLLQLLADYRVSNKTAWAKALIPIIIKASHDVSQNVQGGEDTDIRHYIKLKKIPGGRPKDSAVYSGAVFTKNVALKTMAKPMSNPNVLILTFPLEYARHQKFMSLEPVIRQEKEYLQNLVHRIVALQPNLLLVGSNISGRALEYLEEAGISVAYNVKRSVLEAVARMAQTKIINSMDKLAVKPAQPGQCQSFYLKTFMYQARKKTCMFLTGCPKELGCTIILRGSDEETLRKVKKISEFMIYVAYNLKLEAAFMRDEFASMPSYATRATIIPDADAAKKKPDAQEIKAIKADVAETEANSLTIGGGKTVIPEIIEPVKADEVNPQFEDADEIKLPDDTPMPTFYSDMMERSKETILSCSPCVRFMQPYLIVRAREQERRLIYLKSLRGQESDIQDQEKPSEFLLITPDMLQGDLHNAPIKVREVIRAVQDAQYDKAIHNYQTTKKQWERYAAGNQEMFTPLTHQNIAVLYSVVCASTSVPCRDPKVQAVTFYDERPDDDSFEGDLPLGYYIEARCIEAYDICLENACDSKMIDHRHQYVHADGQVSVTIEQHSSKIAGYQDIILMWNVCRICGEETQTTQMSEETWKYSWGKFLELSFWGHELRPRAANCSHDLHKDYYRYFGLRNLAVRFQYDKVNLLEIVVPRTRITWKVSNDLRFKNEVYLRAEERINKFMNSVKARLASIRIESILPEKADTFKEEISRLNHLAQEHHAFLINKLQAKYMGSKYYEIIPFNRAIRAMEEKSVEWDNIFQDFDQNYFPSEKDIRRLATLQLKKMFLDRDNSVESFSSEEKTVSTSMTSSLMTGQTSPDDVGSLTSPSQMSSKEAHEMMSSVVEENMGSPEKHSQLAESMGDDALQPKIDDTQNRAVDAPKQEDTPNATPGAEPVPEVEHLDLAVGPETLARTISQQSDKTLGALTPRTERPIGDNPIVGEPDTITTTPTKHSQKSEAESPEEEDTAQTPKPGMGNVRRKSGFRSAIPLYRAKSQPERGDGTVPVTDSITPLPISSASNATSKRLGFKRSSPEETRHHERKTSDRFGIGAFKASFTQSMIPRSTLGKRKESKVSALAKHFEELSREFERERRRDKQRAVKARQSRAFPSAAAVPIVEEFGDFHDAAEFERDSLEDSTYQNEAYQPNAGEEVAHQLSEVNDPEHVQQHLEDTTDHSIAGDTADETAEETAAETEAEDQNEERQQEMYGDEDQTPIVESQKSIEHHHSLQSETSIVEDAEPTPSMPDSSEMDFKIDIPKHEKTSLMKMLTNFWAERSASGWAPLDYPLSPTDHVFANSDIIVREDEPSSLIAFVLGSDAYQAKLKTIAMQHADVQIPDRERFVSDHFLTGEDQAHIERSLLQSTGTHFKYQFQEGSAKMMCKVFYVEQFEAVRRKCGIDGRFIESLSRCLKWDSKGGKTKSVFLKTLDDRLVLKSLSPIETQAFQKFAPSYFTLMGEALFHDLPSVIAKMVGFFQIVIKNPQTGVEFNWYLLVMENLFYDRVPTRTFDLKGSMRNRRIQPTGEQNEVLLDENMVEYIFEKPLFAREHSKRLISLSVYNDTLFLSRQNVMDYSLMVAIDEDKKELVVGIIDCIRTYTWDKKLESWMKDRGKNRPTVTSPKEYKARFRAAMDRYVLQAPTCWHQYKQDEERGMREDIERAY